MSKDERYAASQSITTVGIVEQVTNATAADDLVRHTAKRSVFSAEELRGMGASESSPVKMIDFLLVGHIQPPVRLGTLVSKQVFSNRPPQSIAEWSEEQYERFQPYLRLGFDHEI
jgi:hypothetical protein